MEVTGPVGAGTPVFPPGTVITTTESNTFETTKPFTISTGVSLKDAADILHTTIVPGEYDFTVTCQDSVFGSTFGTFTGAISFTDSTHYNTGPGPLPPTSLTVTGANGTVYSPGQTLVQTGTDHYTITMQAPIGLPGTWRLTDNGPALISGPYVDAGTNKARWDWFPDSAPNVHHLVATFHPDCAAGQSCPPDVTATETYQVFEAIPTPVSVALTLSVTPTSPVPAGTTETLTATVSPPIGSVQFYDGDAPIDSHPTLSPGTHMLTARDTPPQPPFAIPGGPFTFRSPVVTYVVNPPTPTPSPTPSPGPTPAAGIISTTTTLQVAPNPGFTFFPEFLVARVAPANAVGTVQFFDGNTPLGSPLPETGGFAFLSAPLPEGTHSLTAMFTATDPAALTPSTSSPVSLTVQSIFGGLGFWGGNTPPWPLLGRNTPPGAPPGGAITSPHR